MVNFLVKIFIKNPVGLIVLGSFVTLLGLGMPKTSSITISGIIITAIGIFWRVMRIRRENQAIEANLPVYLEMIDALQKNGYQVEEFEHKRVIISSRVLLNGNVLGEFFLVAPPPNKTYAQFRRMEAMKNKEFEHDYSQIFRISPSISASYWPDISLIGAFIVSPIENYSEKEEWLLKIAHIFQEKVL